MAIAGIHSVSVLESTFLRESQSQSPPRQVDEQPRLSTGASSVLRMWRELEDEHAVSRAQERLRERLFQQRSESFGPELSRTDSSESHESEHSGDSENDCTSENSSDIGEQRGRVRQVSQELINGPQTNMSPRAEWLAQMNSPRRGRESQPAESGSQIESQRVQRGNRRLCGRQALVDMVKKAEMERKTELQRLLEHRAVTNFPHRNRIQSLLRGWFLRNGRSTEKRRPSSVAESELGLLRQKHTVSGLRGEFISRLDSSASAQASSSLSDTSNDDSNSNTNVQTQESTEYEILNDTFEQSESNYGGSDDQENESHETSNGRDGFQANAVGHVDSEESNAQQDQVPDDARSRECQGSTSLECDERRQSSGIQSQDDTANDQSQSALVHTHLEELVERSRDQSEPNQETNDFLGLSGSGDNLEHNNTADDTRNQESVSEDQTSVSEERDWDQDVTEYTEWRDGINENADSDQQQAATEIGWSIENEDTENRPVEEEEEAPEEWHEEESVQSWLEEPSDQEPIPVRQPDTYYFPDDDNVYSTEIRELLSRRRVSNLLGSGFRDSLNQLIQSYVERQGNAATDWGLNGSPPPEPADPHQDQPVSTLTTQGLSNVLRPPISLPPPPPPPMRSPPTWDRESHHHDNWTQHVMHQRLGIEWEIINDMRIDMARLQQRMNNLQRMLETCMDMQLELQRSIRQEVSSALNRSSGSQGSNEAVLTFDDSKWDHVRKGTCCVCCDNSIDSLLYRCGHMCTCANCANELIESRGKCPMCRAPVVEVIRAYSIL